MQPVAIPARPRRNCMTGSLHVISFRHNALGRTLADVLGRKPMGNALEASGWILQRPHRTHLNPVWTRSTSLNSWLLCVPHEGGAGPSKNKNAVLFWGGAPVYPHFNCFRECADPTPTKPPQNLPNGSRKVGVWASVPDWKTTRPKIFSW